MSTVAEYVAAATASHDRLEAAQTKQTADITWIKAQLEVLNNSPGTFTPADQATVDALLARTQAAAVRAEEIDALIEDQPPPPTA